MTQQDAMPNATDDRSAIPRGAIERNALETAPLYPASRLLRSAESAAIELRDDAAEQLARARIQAQEIIRSAHQAAAEIRESALEASRVQAASRLFDLIASLEAAAEQWQRDQADQLARSSVRIAGALLKGELAVSPERIAELAAQTLARARHDPMVAIELHPDDAVIVSALHEDVTRAARHRGSMSVISNDRLARGSVILHTTQGAFDGSLATRLAELERMILQELASTPHKDTSEIRP